MSPVKRVVLSLIGCYQATRRWRLPMCRFYPSCSTYAHQAISKHGLVMGSILAAVRLVKCQPLHPGGIDEVPDQLFAYRSAGGSAGGLTKNDMKYSKARRDKRRLRQLPKRTATMWRSRSVLTRGGDKGDLVSGATNDMKYSEARRQVRRSRSVLPRGGAEGILGTVGLT